MASQISLREQVYHFFWQQMQSGSLSPGTSINLNDISKKLGISKTPLRDALIQLEIEGFVTILPRRGVIVNKLYLHEIKSSYEILGALESAALLSIFDKIKNSHIEQMEDLNGEQREALDAGEYEHYYRLNLAFHDVFLNLSDNTLIKKILAPIKRRLYDFPRRAYIKEWELINIDEHDRLITCVKKGNRLGAASTIKDEHWSYDYHQKYLKRFYRLSNEGRNDH
jgi:DNA-binding GntR family transcriptional regulator